MSINVDSSGTPVNVIYHYFLSDKNDLERIEIDETI
jgi:hypothetical protein